MLRSILHDLFGDLSNGRLMRIPFVLYILGGLILLFPLTVLFATTAGSLAAASGIDLRWLGYPFVAIVTFVACNLVTKRIRDIGLPGWTTFVAANVLSFGLIYVAPEMVGRTLSAIIYVALLFVPSDAIRTKPSGARDRQERRT